jgi:HK97 family phage portal protein
VFTLRLFGKELLALGMSKPGTMAAIHTGDANYSHGFPSEKNKAAAIDAYQGPVYANIRVIANRAAAMMRTLAVGTWNEQDQWRPQKHVLTDVLWAKPNPLMSGFYFSKFVVGNIMLAGTSPTLILKNRLGKPGMLWPLSPVRTAVVWDEDDWVSFRYTLPSGGVIEIPAENVLYWRDVNYSKVMDGYSATQAASLLIDTDRFLWEHERKMFEKGIFSRWVVKYPQDAINAPRDENEARLVAERFGQKVADQDKHAEPFIAVGGMEVQPFTVANSDLDAVALSEIVEKRLRQVYGVPRGLTGDTDNQPRANLEASNYVFNQHVVEPLLYLISEEMNSKLMPLYDSGLECRFDNPVENDKDFELRQEVERLRSKVWTINEVRESEGLDPVIWGEMPWGQLAEMQIGAPRPAPTGVPPTMNPIDEVEQDEEETEEDEEVAPDDERGARSRSNRDAREQRWRKFVADSEAWENRVIPIVRGLLDDAEARTIKQLRKVMPRFLTFMVTMSKKQVRSMLEQKRSSADDVADVVLWGRNDWNETLRPVLLSIYEQAGKAQGAELAIEFAVFTAGISSVASHLAKSTDIILQALQGSIKETLSEGLLAGEGLSALEKRIRVLYEGLSEGRARTIARTETVFPMNLGQIDAMRQGGVTRKEWITTMDGNERDWHGDANGQVVGVNEDFVVMGERLSAPGDSRGSAANVINCRCVAAPYVDETDFI